MRFFCFIILIFSINFVDADEYRPAYLELIQTSETKLEVLWKLPAKGSKRLDINIEFPLNTMISSKSRSSFTGGAYIEQSTITHPSGLIGETISISGLERTPTDVLVRFQYLNGSSETTRINAAASAFEVRAAPNFYKVIKTYLVFGIEHILEGKDHLLFIACLVFIARTWKRILFTITGFTLAHSITLTLAALELVQLPIPPIEATIALSIVFLARELALERRDTLTWRYPIAVSASFGLIHGFGFASALADIGLPQTDLSAALLAFNTGVEIGQIVFVVTLLFTFWIIAKAVAFFQNNSIDFLQQLERPTAYCAGSLAMYWTLERVSGYWII